MTKVLIVRGEDRHTYRLEQSMHMCDVECQTVQKYEDIPDGECDVVFVDPSLSYDPTTKLNSDHIIFYDCEDGHKDFSPGASYYAMRDKVEYYAKMNWVDEDRNDGVRNIGFPLSVYAMLTEFAKAEIPPFTHQNAFPFFVGTGTFLGNYTEVPDGVYARDDSINLSSIGRYNAEELMYNQRIDWLLSLQHNNIPHLGGLVFAEHNLSREWQSEHFGSGVASLGVSRVDHGGYMQGLVNFRIGLCPTGHDRMSWRVFDIMAMGAILIWTDVGDQKSMYMPKEYITVKDGEDLGKQLLTLQPDYYDIWKAHQENRKVFANLTPDKVWDDFMEQMT